MREVVDYCTVAAANIATLMNPETLIIAGDVARGAPLIVDALSRPLDGNVYDRRA